MKQYWEDNHGIHVDSGDHREFRLALREDEKLLESALNRLREARVPQPNR